MAACRLTESQKRELVEGYRSGESTASLAKTYGCSPNTVSRTVKALLSNDEYTALKSARARGGSLGSIDLAEDSLEESNQSNREELEAKVCHDEFTAEDSKSLNLESLGAESEEQFEMQREQDSGPLALDDADDFEDDSEEESSDEDIEDAKTTNKSSSSDFHEVVPLNLGFDLIEQKEVPCKPLSSCPLPSSVYMLVNKIVELDARPLKEFPELGFLPEEDQGRYALCLFANQRSAKRNCGRSQRVIKIPDTSVFSLTTPYLLSRGITRLLLEGTLISIESEG